MIHRLNFYYIDNFGVDMSTKEYNLLLIGGVIEAIGAGKATTNAGYPSTLKK